MVNKKNKKVVVAISGGVDSAVAALLLQKQGFEVFGVFMRLGDNGVANEQSARLVCLKLGIKFFPINVSEKFEKEVIGDFVKSYQNGLTPNPCVRCNKLIKFGELFRVTEELGADYLATGHYIKKIKVESGDSKGIYKLFRGIDDKKDQSYFLYNFNQDQLKKVLFPLGDFTKEEIKKVAEENSIPSQSSESQDICFMVRDEKILDHNEFLKDRIQASEGEIKTLDGKTVGRHKGLPFYTIGQRRGIEIGGIGPFYAVHMDYDKNILYVTNDSNDKALYKDGLMTENVNWISGVAPKTPLSCQAMIRYRHKAENCVVTPDNGDYKVKFEKAQRAITAGQSVVFYKDNELLGGGVIKSD